MYHFERWSVDRQARLRQAEKNFTHSNDSRTILKSMGSFRLRLQDDTKKQ